VQLSLSLKSLGIETIINDIRLMDRILLPSYQEYNEGGMQPVIVNKRTLSIKISWGGRNSISV